MKRILNVATATRKQPYYGRHFDHMNENASEIAKSLAEKLISTYITGDVSILYGCVNSGASSGAGLAFNVSAGAVYYNGEIYQVAAFAGVFTGTNVIVGTLTTAYQAGEPSLCSDGTLQFLAEKKIFVLSQGATASGTKDLTAFTSNTKIASEIKDTPGALINGGTSYTLLTTMTYTTPNDGFSRKYKISFKCICTGSSGTNTNQVDFNMQQTTGTPATLDHTMYYHTKTDVTDVVVGTPTLEYIGTLPPNTTVEIQKKWTVGATTIADLKMCIEEIR